MDRIYSQEEALKASTEYFNDDSLAADVWVKKYALRNENGELLECTPSNMHHRLAKEFARIEANYPNPMSENEIYDLLKKTNQNDLGMGYIIPQGSPMSAIGNPYKLQSLSNCFVIPSPQDSYGGILYTDQQQAQIMKRRGGVGFDISTIRPKGITTANAAGTTDGIAVFMERFSNTCREVAQGGRRGALMCTILVSHPEIETFINIKRDLTKVTGANISIKLSDAFMNAVKNDDDFTLQWPVDVPLEKAKVIKVVKAKDIWNQIIDAAWTSAEPGLLFWDTVKKNTPADAYESKGYGSISTNPCAELVLCAMDSCRLLVLDLTKFVINPFKHDSEFNFIKFNDFAIKAQRLMDDLVDLEIEAIDKITEKIKTDPEREEVKSIELNLWKSIKEVASAARRTGLGITALGDALAMLGIKYGSDASIEMTEKIYKSLSLAAYRSSVIMAKERGTFSAYDYNLEKDHSFINKIMNLDNKLKEDWKKYGRRNIALTTTAPGGSISTLTQTTSGIEPVFMISYKRRRKLNPNDHETKIDFIDQMGDKWQEYVVYHHAYRKWLDSQEILNDPTQQQIERSPYYGATANEIDWVKSIDLMSSAQKWICHSLSKTVNLPNSVTQDEVAAVYMRGWESGCKGVTVYRDGCRTGVLVSIDEKKEKKTEFKFEQRSAPKRPESLECHVHRAVVRSGDVTESYLVFVGMLDGKPYEIFCGPSGNIDVPKKAKYGQIIKKIRKDGNSKYDLIIPIGDDDSLTLRDIVHLFDSPNDGALTRTISLALRHGAPVQYIVEQLQKDKRSDMQSFNRVVARVLKNYIPNGTTSSDKKCYECGSENALVYKEGCVSCVQCAASKCS